MWHRACLVGPSFGCRVRSGVTATVRGSAPGHGVRSGFLFVGWGVAAMGLDPRDESFNGDEPFEGDESGDAARDTGQGSPRDAGSDPAGKDPVAVPDELDHMPPGPLLAEILDDVPVQQVSGFDSVVVLAAAHRQLCRQQAVFYEALAETGLRAPGSASAVARLSAPGEFACEEGRAALVWSRQRAQREYQLGFDLFVRFPELGEALRAGRIDLPRARAFVEWTDGLTDAQAATIINHLLPDAASMVVGALIDQIKRAAIAVDPEWAERRYAAAVKTRRVRGFRSPDGTASLGGYAQPVDRVAAACARIDQLARACKAGGDRRRLDLVRSDLYLRMLDGTFEAMSDAQVIAFVRANPLDDLTGRPDETDDGDRDPDDRDGDGGTPGGPGHGGDGGQPGGHDGTPGRPVDRGAEGVSEDRDARASGEEGCNGGDGGPRPGPSATGVDIVDSDTGSDGEPAEADRPDVEPADAEPADVSPADAEPADTTRRAGSGDAAVAAPAGYGDGVPTAARGGAGTECSTRRRGSGVAELRVQLITLLGHSDAPGELPGWDFLPAGLARRLVHAMASAEWRWVVCDPDGHAVDAGLTGVRPSTMAPARRDSRRGGIVELAITHADLQKLAVQLDRCGPWAPVLADIARQRGEELGNGYNDRGGGRSWPRPAADRRQQAGRRFPGARLRRWVQIRDRGCQHPCCRAKAVSSQIDHRRGWASGGPTIDPNLGPLCAHDHRVKDETSWHLDRPEPGLAVWTSPLGHTATRRIAPVIHPPVPIYQRDDGVTPDPIRGRHELCRCLLHPCPHDEAADAWATDADNAGADDARPDDAGAARSASADHRMDNPGDQGPIHDDEPPF
jgi:Domain of unknown function (DUF222)